MRARFWRNVTLIALAHVALLALLLRWSGETKAAETPNMTWLSGESAPGEAESAPDSPVLEPTPEPAESATPVNSDIVIPHSTPVPTVSPTAPPKPKKKSTPKPSAAPAKKKIEPSRAKKEKKESAEKKQAGAGVKSSKADSSGTGGGGSGKSDAATANYYSNMLHDRFYRAWEQPQTVLASGIKLAATARIRIEKDGRVSDFKIVKPSGNVLVDESVRSVAAKVTRVDALPAGMGSNGHYDVNVNFALNSE
jgi:periplasmic protein TonB